MSRARVAALVTLLLVVLLVTFKSSAQEASYSSLQEAWKSVIGKCGDLRKEEGVFIVAIGKGDICIVSVGADHVVLAGKGSGSYNIYVPFQRSVLYVPR